MHICMTCMTCMYIYIDIEEKLIYVVEGSHSSKSSITISRESPWVNIGGAFFSH